LDAQSGARRLLKHEGIQANSNQAMENQLECNNLLARLISGGWSFSRALATLWNNFIMSRKPNDIKQQLEDAITIATCRNNL